LGKSADARQKAENTETNKEGERLGHEERIGTIDEEGRDTI
jgi:hypothetical protein